MQALRMTVQALRITMQAFRMTIKAGDVAGQENLFGSEILRFRSG